MSGELHHLPCERGIDAGAYVLDALDDHEAEAYAQHLHVCAPCTHEVEALQLVVDQLPIAAPQATPPAAMKGRLMAVVNAEAELLRAAGPEADRVAAPTKRAWRLPSLSGFSLRPAFAAGLACALVALGLAGGLLVGGEGGPQTRTVAAWAEGPASAELVLTGDKASLRLAGLKNPPSGKVYQVWLEAPDGTKEPTHTLFTVRDDGRAEVVIDEPVRGVKRILVTAEPTAGSQVPTSSPIIAATPA